MVDIIQVIENLFLNRTDVYVVQLDGLNEYKVIKEPINKGIIANHLGGKLTIGAFQINPQDNNVKWICFDFDGDLKEELEKAKRLYSKLKDMDFHPLLEFSGRRGYHVWLFIEPTDAKIAREFANKVSKEASPHEIFPKQDKIEKTGFGGQVKVPLGLHRVSNKRSILFDDDFNELADNDSIKFLIRFYEIDRDKIITTNIHNFI